MQEIYKNTSLTPLSVAKSIGYLDYASQPSLGKQYPSYLFRYSYETIEALAPVEMSRFVSFETTIASSPYKRLNTPSAGNLHPIELYVQIRGVKGVISGIYYVDPWNKELVLLEEVSKDGFECFVGLEHKYNGFLFFLSLVPFRSAWKYKTRAFRYCYLDLGHQIAAIDAAATLYGKKMQHFCIEPQERAQKAFGFGADEFICASVGIGALDTSKKIQSFNKDLIYVSPTDYSALQNPLRELLKEQKTLKTFAYKSIEVDPLQIITRRSARNFGVGPLDKKVLIQLLQKLCVLPSELECYALVIGKQGLRSGIYKDAKILREGDFIQTAFSLMLEQSFIKRAAVAVFITSKEFRADLISQAGALTHHIALYAQKNDLGLSPIGAFYDAKVQTFLQTSSYIISSYVVGNKEDQCM